MKETRGTSDFHRFVAAADIKQGTFVTFNSATGEVRPATSPDDASRYAPSGFDVAGTVRIKGDKVTPAYDYADAIRRLVVSTLRDAGLSPISDRERIFVDVIGGMMRGIAMRIGSPDPAPTQQALTRIAEYLDDVADSLTSAVRPPTDGLHGKVLLSRDRLLDIACIARSAARGAT